MTLKKHDKYPTINLWQRLIKRLCGGQDFVVIILIMENGDKVTEWFTGVDMEDPIFKNRKFL